MDKEKLDVTVEYPAAREPFHDRDATEDETLAVFKPEVLKAFGLVEGSTPQGTVTYTLYHKKEPLEDLSRALGSIAGHAHALTLKLAQQIIQG